MVAPCAGWWNQTCDARRSEAAKSAAAGYGLPRHDAVGCRSRPYRRREEVAMSSRLLTCLFAASTLFTVACDDSSGLPSGQAANVRIVNASSVAGDVDVLVN